ncbi:aspartyl protease family protein [Kordia sp.]|uniref:aspartyl protease family protein n=1 Tax=Kordia sp. TaxID=1965332 RepID=UPI003D6A8660
MKKTLITIGLCVALFVGYSFSTEFRQTHKSSQETVKGELNLEGILLKNGYVKIPLTKIFTGHLQLQISINGVEGNFILDTGANSTTVDAKAKAKFKMKAETSEQLATSAGITDILLQESTGNTLRLESLELKDYTVFLMNLDVVNKALENYETEEIDGIIGADILSEKEAIIDYAKLTLYLKK